MARRSRVGRGKDGNSSAKKSEFLSIRLTHGQKEALDAAAKRHGRRLSRHAEVLLQGGLDADRRLQEQLGPPHARALGLMVSRLAEFIERQAGVSWREHSYVAAALGAGIRKLLADLGPTDGMQVPEKLKRAWANAESAALIEDPRAVGEWAAVTILELVRSAPSPGSDEAEWDGAILVARDAEGNVDPKGEPRLIDFTGENRFWMQIASDLNVAK